MSVVGILQEKGLIKPPSFIKNNIQYEVMMGSIAYGVSSDASDIDLYGFCIPYKDIIFPHLAGEIEGFGRQKQKFEQFQQHHINDAETRKQYDISMYNIVKYFQLVAENNPNMLDSLFVPLRCILHSTKIGNMVRENRKMFLHKGCYFKLKGYAYSQLHKATIKNPEGKRKEIVEKYGVDVKFLYHVVRLVNECEQILVEEDLDLERSREQLKAIRNGEMTLEQVTEYFHNKEKILEDLYKNNTLPNTYDELKVKNLLLNCLEEHYGSLDNCIVKPDVFQDFIKEMSNLVVKYKGMYLG